MLQSIIMKFELQITTNFRNPVLFSLTISCCFHHNRQTHNNHQKTLLLEKQVATTQCHKSKGFGTLEIWHSSLWHRSLHSIKLFKSDSYFKHRNCMDSPLKIGSGKPLILLNWALSLLANVTNKINVTHKNCSFILREQITSASSLTGVFICQVIWFWLEEICDCEFCLGWCCKVDNNKLINRFR